MDTTVSVNCMGSGAGVGMGGIETVSVSDTETFGMAAWGETVSFRSYLREVDRGAGTDRWLDSGRWLSYSVTDNTSGQWLELEHPVIGGTSMGTSPMQTWNVRSGVWTYAGLYVYTKRAGLRWLTVPATLTFAPAVASRGWCGF
jgi:hypothetical protein